MRKGFLVASLIIIILLILIFFTYQTNQSIKLLSSKEQPIKIINNTIFYNSTNQIFIEKNISLCYCIKCREGFNSEDPAGPFGDEQCASLGYYTNNSIPHDATGKSSGCQIKVYDC